MIEEHEFIELLKVGISREELELKIAQALGIDPGLPEVVNTRMNWVGYLRQQGYLIPKKRGYYQIVGWEAKKNYYDASKWVGHERDLLDWIYELPELTLEDRPWFEESLITENHQNFYHESCFPYFWCYEGATWKGFKYEEEEGNALICVRSTSYPRLSIFNLNLSIERCFYLAQSLSPASTKPIRILHCSPYEVQIFKMNDRRGYIMKRQEAVYDLRFILDNQNTIFNKRAREMFRKNKKWISWDRTSPLIPGRIYDEEKVIQQWKLFNEKKHRQLAITRDFRALDCDKTPDYHFLGLRNRVGGGWDPCCLHILATLPDKPDTVAQIVEKSLNYSAIPGGSPGTADFNLVCTAEYLLSQGIKYINAGGYDGGGWGLPTHKARFAKPEDDIYSLGFEFSYPHLDREKYVITK